MRHIKISFLFVAFLVFTCSTLTAQPSPPDNHGSSGNEAPENGGGAPIGGGAIILSLLAAGYGLKKWYGQPYKKKE